MNRPIDALQLKIPLEQLQGIHRPITEAYGMPNPAYTEQGFFEFERDHILGKHWTAVAFVEQFEKGMVRPIDFMGLPILISRTKRGEMKVFHNVCSHRGMKLVDAERKTNGLIVCPYHSWTYSVEGDLKSTPHIGGVGVHEVEGFSCAKHGLKPIRSHIWLGILFINLSGKAAEFEQDAAEIIARYRNLMGDSGESISHAASTHAGVSLEVECNWKLAIENYLEAYHLPFIHPGLNSYSPLNEHHNEIIAEKCAGQVTATFDPKLETENPLPIFPDWDNDRLAVGEYPVIYPNLLMGFQANHLFAIIIHPTSPTTCSEELMLFYVGEAAKSEQFDEARKANLEAWIEVFNEDLEPCERMQVGRQSPGYQGGAFSPVHDTCSHHFHKWIATQYERAYLEA